MNSVAVIILAAGKSTRMKSATPKVLHPICARPMLAYVLDLVKSLKIKKVVAVLGHKAEQVKRALKPEIKVVIQKRPLGTADAVRQAASVFRNFKGTILILYADTPLLKKETVAKLLKHHLENSPAATLLTANLEKPSGYGRILRDKYSSICGIVEDKDADDFQKDIKEINTGIVCFDKRWLYRALKDVRADNRKKEYYLTDTIALLYKRGAVIDSVKIEDINEALGINSRIDLARAQKIMQSRLNERHMAEGVSIIDPDSAFISYGVNIGRDTVIYPFTVIESDVRIGRHCSVGPFAHVREGTRIEDNVVVGNFLEISRSRISKNTFVKHFGFIGDSRIGKGVNIGAGAVTANFDGKSKNPTVIKDGAFIGCDTVLIAPLTIGKSARTGAGSVVTKQTHVADNAVVVGIPARPVTIKKR